MPNLAERRDLIANALIQHEHDGGDLAELLAQSLSKALTALRAERAA